MQIMSGNTKCKVAYFSGGSRLPSAFQEVEYIESTGTQYIDTGIKPNDDIEIISKFATTDTTQSLCYVFGSFTINDGNRIQFSYSDPAFVGWGRNYNDTTSISLDNNEHTIVANKNNFKLDNTLIYTPTSHSFTLGSLNLYLFCRNGNGMAGSFAKLKLYSFSIKDNSVLVRNFVPCYRKADNVAGLYDLVNGVFYTNAGTGDFIVGNDVDSVVAIKCQVH